MKNLRLRANKSLIIVPFLLALIVIIIHVNSSEEQISRDTNINQKHTFMKKKAKENKEQLGMELYPMGSSLPDCTQACRPCVPCKRVMVSYKCATESCPVVYKCTCNGKYYHVPSQS